MTGLDALIALFVVGGLYVWNLSRSAGHLIFFPQTVNNIGFGAGNPFADLTILVQNPSNAAFTINSIAANVYTDGYLVGNVSNFQQITIPGNNQQQVSLHITFQMLGIINDIIRAFQYGSSSKELTVEGSANINGFSQDIVMKFKVGL